jgi:tRNA (cmo5U34)-methyltransferase
MENNSNVWKNRLVVESFLHGKRGDIPYASDQLKIMLHLLQYNETPIKKFIDLGAGDGILSQMILERFNDSQGCLIDFSELMIESAYKRLENYLSRIKILNCDISDSHWQEITFGSQTETIDAVVSGFTIHHLSHRRKNELYQEIYNHLSHNGIFINVEHVAPTSRWGAMLNDELCIDTLLSIEEKQENRRTREQIARDHFARKDKNDNLLLSAETQCDWLREIGFKDVDVYFKSFELAVFAGRRLDITNGFNPLNG